MIKSITITLLSTALLLANTVNSQKVKKKEFEKIEKPRADDLLKTYNGILSDSLSNDAKKIYLLSNGAALVFFSFEKKAYYYFDSKPFTKDPYEDDEYLANQDFFANFEENRKAVIRYIDSIYPAKDVGSFYLDSNTKRQSDFLHKVLLKDKNHISFRNGMIFIGEIINHVNGFEWRTEKVLDIRVNKEIIQPCLYDPVKNKKVYTHYFKELIEYNIGDRKKIYL